MSRKTLAGRRFVSKNGGILLANSNQWYFNKLVKIPCHKTPYRCPHRLNLSSQSSRSCAGPNIKVLKDKDLEFANSIRRFFETTGRVGKVNMPVRNVAGLAVRDGQSKSERLWGVVFHIPVLPKMYVIWVIRGSRSRKKRDISRKYHVSRKDILTQYYL